MAAKNSTIQIRVTPSEKKVWQYSAKENGLSLSVWIRLVLMNAGLRAIVANQEKPKRKRG